jgi:hypothetical protein
MSGNRRRGALVAVAGAVAVAVAGMAAIGHSGGQAAAARRADVKVPTTALTASHGSGSTTTTARHGERDRTGSGHTAAAATKAHTESSAVQPSPPDTARCNLRDLSVVVVTDRATYKLGDTVTIRATLTNNGTTTCYMPVFDTVRITDSSGTVVFNGSYPNDAHMPAMGHGQTTPNTTHWYKGQMCGPQYHPGCTQTVSPGTFTVHVGWLSNGGTQPPSLTADTQPFTLT